MTKRAFSLRFSVFFVLLFPSTCCLFSAEENFVLINATTDETVLELGPHIHERFTPCSTFKIALSLMGFESGILEDIETPSWDFQEGYLDYIDSWKASQNPFSWMKTSCVWYSQLLAVKLGMQNIQNYLELLEYGNQDMSGGLMTPKGGAWISSSLKISTREQVDLIQKMLLGKLPISSSAIELTKSLLFIKELPGGWKLFGKTGYGNRYIEIGWFIGWVEKEDQIFVFAYNICDEHGRKIITSQRIPRVKQLLIETGTIEN